jgi:hypothetical protein
MKLEPKIKPGDIYIDFENNYQKCERIMFYSYFYNEWLYIFHSGKIEYECTILTKWKKTNLLHTPGEQIKLF